MNGRDVLSNYAQISNGIQVERDAWIELLAEDTRASVLDQVAARIDVRAWLKTLSNRMRWIARDLAVGCTTSEVASKYGVTRGRISQLRRELEASWLAFQSVPAVAVAR